MISILDNVPGVASRGRIVGIVVWICMQAAIVIERWSRMLEHQIMAA